MPVDEEELLQTAIRLRVKNVPGAAGRSRLGARTLPLDSQLVHIVRAFKMKDDPVYSDLGAHYKDGWVVMYNPTQFIRRDPNDALSEESYQSDIVRGTDYLQIGDIVLRVDDVRDMVGAGDYFQALCTVYDPGHEGPALPTS